MIPACRTVVDGRPVVDLVAGLLALPKPGEPGAPSLARYRSR
jgi:hypothetical protein